MRKEMLIRLHSSHLGLEKSINRARNCVFWPNINNDLKNVIKNCNACATYRNSLSKEPLMPHEVPKYPWQKVGIDIFHFNHKNYILCVDYYSKFFELSVLDNMLATTTIKNLKSIFSRQGIPEIIMSDNGPQFSAGEFKLFAKQWEFQHITSSPRYPKSNGLVERHIQTIKNVLRKCKANNNDMYLAMLELRNTPTKGHYTPSQLLNKRSLRSVVPVNVHTKVNYEQYEKTVLRNQHKGKQYHDKHSKLQNDFKVQERVRVQVGKKWVPGKIEAQCDRPRSYRIKLNNDQEIDRNRKYIILDTVKPPGIFSYANLKEEQEVRETEKRHKGEDEAKEKQTKKKSETDTDFNETDLESQQVKGRQTVTRSGRTVKPPSQYWKGKTS